MKRLFHNFLQSLRKDSGAHFTYNLGAAFMRAGAALILAAVFVLVFTWVKPFVTIKYLGKTEAVFLLRWTPSKTPFLCDWAGPPFESHRYVLSFDISEYPDTYDRDIYVSEKTYEKYVNTAPGTAFELNLYRTDFPESYYYLSEKSTFGAALECAGAAPPDTSGMTAAFWLLLAAAPLIAFGLREEHIGMKYPRSDVPLDISGAPVPVYDDASIDEAAKAYRAEIHERLHRRMLTGGSDIPGGERSADDEAPVP